MNSDNRLSRMLHLLIHMSQHDKPLTSDDLARMLNTNPVVVRRTMAGLRDQALVVSEKGHGGGWLLGRKLADIHLLDVYQALGEPPVFALGLSDDHAQCLVEQAVNAGLGEALQEARAMLLERFGQITLAELAADFERRYAVVRAGEQVEESVAKAGK
jgi:DNA-binding IscR family transcriptional regulator